MMRAQGWEDFATWHELFDALCNRRGWYDNAQPASEMCALLGKSRVQDFESAKKKLRGWRAGQRVPLRRNVVVLGRMLGVEADPDLHRRWSDLYRRAHAGQAPGALRAPPASPRAAWGWRAGRPAAVIAALSGCAIAAYAASAVLPTGTPDELPVVRFEGQVNVPLGASVLIHGALAGCEAPPPDWRDAAIEMPVPVLGRLDDGGLARKVVRICGRERIVRAVRYTGLRTGTERLRIFGDHIRVDVADVRDMAVTTREGTP